jgi:Mg/Co/Ni transporter MgtE
MRKLINRIIQWAIREEDMRGLETMKNRAPEVLRSDTMPSLRLGIVKAMNGRILEVSSYTPNKHGPDWTTEMFIVPEDQSLTQALTTLLVMKGLNT